MNSESNSKIQRTQSGKPTSYKRAHRAKRPVLVTGEESTMLTEAPALDLAETPATSAVAIEEQPAAKEAGLKRGPRFFSSVGKAEKTLDQPKVDPIAARLSRALRGKRAESSSEKEPVQEKKAAASVSKGTTTSTPARPKSNFKMKYIWGMALYLLIADFLGVWIQSWMKSQGLDANVFTIGAFQASRSTLIFLALLVIILVLMARFDMIPRSFGAAMNGQATQRAGSKTAAKTPTFESKEAQPTIRQGVKGANDDLYREYRETQRYYQKRDRKR